jgi:hypothetical protein
MTLFDFSKQIAQLKKEKNYSEALLYFKNNKTIFTQEQISNNEYVISDMLTCLRKGSHLDAGFRFLSLYNIEINAVTKERILSSYGWLLWAKYKAENIQEINIKEEDFQFDDEEDHVEGEDFHYNKHELLQRIEDTISLLLDLKNDFNNTLISNLLNVVLKSEKRKPAPNWKLINDFCDNFDPATLSQKCDTIQITRKGQLKDMELASDFENWYAYKTKALMKMGKWQDCFDTSKEALEKIEKFHYSNDIWFSRRVALSKRNMGNTEETIEELKSILKKKREWFIQKELAELYLENEEVEKAFKLSIDAINNYGPIEFKVDLLFLMGKIHQKKNENELAFKHFSLSKLIRLEEEWKIPQKLYNELTGFSFPEIPLSEIKKLKAGLKKNWNSLLPNSANEVNAKNLHGKITKILNDNEKGKNGFLNDNGTEIYFIISSNFHLTPDIKVGTSVTYSLIPSIEGKKDKAKIIKINMN